ncbi:unnamed protein product [Brachionus calyciflorus]|uniref:Ion transport domain-containing protein n=1 Tax=Brachionus calyciflorus TaxID=104777 RepID=A0A814F017_9BILA|nr:unnamed protein product [Brachionus calyciflorus]
MTKSKQVLPLTNETRNKNKQGQIDEIKKSLLFYIKKESIPNIYDGNLNLNYVKELNFKKQELVNLPQDIFMGLNQLEKIDFSENKITQLFPKTFNGLKKLIFVNFGSNQINSLDLNMFSDQSNKLEINFKNNPIHDFNISWIDFKLEKLKKKFKSICLGNCFDFALTVEKLVEIFEKSQLNNELIFNFLTCLFFHRNVIYKNEEIENFLRMINRNYVRYENKQITLLDYIASFPNDFPLSEIIKHADSINGNELLFRSSQTVVTIFNFGNKELIDICINVLDLYLKKSKYDIFLGINYKVLIERLIEQNNEEMTLKLLNYLKKAIASSNFIEKENFLIIENFQNHFFDEQMYKFLIMNWNKVIEFVLDDVKHNEINFLNLQKLRIYNRTKTNECKIIDKGFSIEKLFKVKHCNVLTFFSELGDIEWLQNDIIENALETIYSIFPRSIYYLNLFFYIIFLIFYSIQINSFNSISSLDSDSKIISIVFSLYFLILEVLQFIESILSKSILLYLFDSKNLLEFSNSIICLTTLFLNNSESKSSLISTSIILSYYILLLRLDKLSNFGVYVAVFNKVVKRSFKLFVIIGIFLIGFLLSFRNRSGLHTFEQMNDEDYISTFNKTFEYTLFRIITMTTGSIDTEEMGINVLKRESFINFIIYLFFILFMPILFVNILIGISIGEVEKLLDNSEVEVFRKKVSYIMKFENLVRLYRINRNSFPKKILMAPFVCLFFIIISICGLLNSPFLYLGIINKKIDKIRKDKKNRLDRIKNANDKFLNAIDESHKKIDNFQKAVETQFKNLENKINELDKRIKK